MPAKNYTAALLTAGFFFIFMLHQQYLAAQNSMVGDGFGGRLWYKPTNYGNGSYAGYTVCGDSLQLYGWGINVNGELGDGTNTSSATPVKVKGMSNVLYFSAGYNGAAIKKDNTAWVWGKDFGTVPQQVPATVKFVDAGQHSATFILQNGTVASVGNNTTGTFGIGNNPGYYLSSPAIMKNISNAVRVANGLYNTVVLLANGEVWVTGGNSWGGLGQGNTVSMVSYLPLKISTLKDIVEIESNVQTNLALDKNGDIYEWGMHFTSPVTAVGTPAKIDNVSNIIAISGTNDGSHFLAIDVNKNCYAWGSNEYGQCGVKNGKTNIEKPVLVATDVIDIMAAETFSYIVKSDGSIWASGSSNQASIWMDKTDISRDSFVEIHPALSPMFLCNPVWIGPTDSTQNITICEGDSAKAGKHVYTQSGHYTDTLKGYQGTDSFVYTHLTVLQHSRVTQHFSLCPGDTLKTGSRIYVQPGTYRDTMSNYQGCDSIITIIFSHKPVSTATQSIHFCPGDSVYFKGRWYKDMATVTDTLSNYAGCDSVLTTTLQLYADLSICPDALFFIPNVFSPNGNSINDYFRVYGWNIKTVQMQIYNRWGEKIFDAEGSDTSWDGIYRDYPSPEGVYLYLINIEGINGQWQEFKGTFTLLR